MSALELDDVTMHAVLQLPDMSEARERARLIAIGAREDLHESLRDAGPPPLSTLAATAVGLHLQAEELSELANVGPSCRDPWLGGEWRGGACLERERRRVGRTSRFDAERMCAACAGYWHADRARDAFARLATGERGAFARFVAEGAGGRARLWGPEAGGDMRRAARRLRRVAADRGIDVAHLADGSWRGRSKVVVDGDDMPVTYHNSYAAALAAKRRGWRVIRDTL